MRSSMVMNYREKVVCDVCRKEIEMPKARIEWGFDSNATIQICHHECSIGSHNRNEIYSDMILDQRLYKDSQIVYARLKQLGEDKPEYSSECDRIIRKIFDL